MHFISIILLPLVLFFGWAFFYRSGHRACFMYYFNQPRKEYCDIITNVPKIRGIQKIDFSKIKSVEWDRMEVSGPYTVVCEFDSQGGSKNCNSLDDNAYISLFKERGSVAVFPADEMVHMKGQEDSDSGKKGAVIKFETNGRGGFFIDKYLDSTRN